MLRESSSKYSA
jgi:hypothetical protein